MGAPKNRSYKRSWKNYLLDAKYQLRFTLVIVVMSAALLGGLGWWVMHTVGESTKTRENEILSRRCQRPMSASAADSGAPRSVPTVTIETPDGDAPPTADALADDDAPPLADAPPDGDAPRGGDAPAAAGDPPGGESEAGAATGEAGGAESGEGASEGGRSHPSVVLDEPELATFVPVEPIVRYHLCRFSRDSAVARLRLSKRQIFWVLLCSSLLLCLGLAAWGIRMTHKVAGPLYKVSLYFDKMRDGTYDPVYNLRKGDELREFYEHFRAAHEGMRDIERADLETLRALVVEVERAGGASKSAAVARKLEELKKLLADKEGSLG